MESSSELANVEVGLEGAGAGCGRDWAIAAGATGAGAKTLSGKLGVGCRCAAAALLAAGVPALCRAIRARACDWVKGWKGAMDGIFAISDRCKASGSAAGARPDAA